MTTAWDELVGTGPAVVDGGLSTQLAVLGQDTSGLLWTGRALLESPETVTRAHADFIAAGAGIVITASYQVSRWGFEQAGLTGDQADAALRSATRAARAAAAQHPDRTVRVAASVGPYGAVLHDGSEYRGNYGRTHQQLVDFHRERLDVLVDSAPDLLAVETIPDAVEAQALVEVLADHPGMPAWVTFSAVDDAHVCAGQAIEEAVGIAASAPSVLAVGINCTDPRHVAGLVARIRTTCDLPVVVYPNAGGSWDAADGEWHGGMSNANDAGDAGRAFPESMVQSWLDAGARAVGGCCGTDAVAISRIAQQLARTAS